MDPSASTPWTPRDEVELMAGWRLWLELADRTWPTAAWDGTPADAVRPLRDLLTACNRIESDFRLASSRESAEIIRFLRSLFLVASSPVELWRDDDRPLNEQRAELLHADLTTFARYADELVTVLALGGGWAGLDIVHRQKGRRSR